MASPLFPDAPAIVRGAACSYRWVAPAASGAVVDLDALTSSPADHLTKGVDAPATCNAPIMAQGNAVLIPPPPSGEASAPTGVVGCDVCARVYGRTLLAILPPDNLDLKTVVVTMVDGRRVTFDVTVPAGTQAFYVALPLDAVDAYKQGSVPLFRAPL